MATAKHLSPEEVDDLPSPRFGNGPVRQDYRYNWGVRAGRASYARGCKVNCFRRGVAHMPMHDGWEHGFREAEREANLGRPVLTHG